MTLALTASALAAPHASATEAAATAHPAAAGVLAAALLLVGVFAVFMGVASSRRVAPSASSAEVGAQPSVPIAYPSREINSDDLGAWLQRQFADLHASIADLRRELADTRQEILARLDRKAAGPRRISADTRHTSAPEPGRSAPLARSLIGVSAAQPIPSSAAAVGKPEEVNVFGFGEEQPSSGRPRNLHRSPVVRPFLQLHSGHLVPWTRPPAGAIIQLTLTIVFPLPLSPDLAIASAHKLTPLLDELRTMDLDDPPSTSSKALAKKHVKQHVKKFITTKVAPAVLGLFTSAAKNVAKSLPFGHVAVAMCEDAVRRVKTMKANREAAENLMTVRVRALGMLAEARRAPVALTALFLQWVELVQDRGEIYVKLFAARKDDLGVRHAEQLLEATFVAFRLICEHSASKSLLQSAVRFIACNSAAEAFDEAEGGLKDSILSVAFLAPPDDGVQGRAAAAAPVFSLPPAVAGTLSAEGRQLWLDNGFTLEASTAALIASLTLATGLHVDDAALRRAWSGTCRCVLSSTVV